jgi:hypothetical protein
MEHKTTEGEREFTGRAMASIFGAPISWIALFGALMGALSIIPMIFYPFGGGFASAGMIIFGPMAGLILGPWAGAIAGLIGGLIGMFISPGSYPLGFIDVMLSGVLLPVFWGLAKPYYPLDAVVDRLLLLSTFLPPGKSGRFWRSTTTHVHPFVHLGSARADLPHLDAKHPSELDESFWHRQTSRWLYPVHGWTHLRLATSLDRRLLLGSQVPAGNR